MDGPWTAFQSAAAGPWSDFQQKPAQPTVGMGDAMARGAAQGVTFNFYDELRGLMEAGGLDPRDPASLTALVTGAAKYWSGDPEAVSRYEAAAQRERGISKDVEAQRPYSSLAGNVAGAVALPLGAALNAATAPARVARGAAVGAGTGAAYGAGEGDGFVDSASRAIVGGGLGAAVGAAAPAAVEGIVRGTRAMARPFADAVRGVQQTDDEAARRVVMALQRDIDADPAAVGRLTPAEFAQSSVAGGPARIMDIGGDTTRALARSSANTSPEGRGALTRSIDERFEGQASRINDFLRSSFNYPDAFAQQKALEATRKVVNRPAYLKAYEDGNKIVLWDDDLRQLAQAPEVQAAIRVAIPQLRNWAVKDGLAPPKGAFDVVNGRTVLKKTEAGNTILPSLQLWDYVKRGLDQIDTPTARAFSRSLRDKLDELVPSYNTARSGAAKFFQAENALEAGQNFVTANFAIPETRAALAKMSSEERKLFQDGFVSRFMETLDKIGDRRSILNQIADSPAAREKLNLALGPQKARELEAKLRVEGIMDLARTAVQGNSTTARQLQELGLAGGAYTVSSGFNPFNPDPQAVMTAALVYGVARGRNTVNERLAKRVAEMLVSRDPDVILKGARVVANNKQLFNSLRSFDKRLASVGGEQAGGVPAIQALGGARADNEQR